MQKIFCTFIILSFLIILEVTAEYRFKQAAQLTIMPDQIAFMNDQILFKEGRNVELRSLGDYSSVLRAFTLPTAYSTVAVFPSSQEIIFSTLTGISKSTKIRPETKLTLSTVNKFQQVSNSFFTISSKGEIFITPPISFSKQMSIVNSKDYSVSALSIQGNYTSDIQLRSEVVATDQAYYFSSGLYQQNQNPQNQYLYFYEGINNTYKNVFNFTIPLNVKNTLYYPKQYLRKISENNQTYFLIAKQFSTSKFVCQMVERIGQSYTSLGVSQQISSKALQLVSKNKMIYFSSTCEIMQSQISQWTSNIQKRLAIDKSLITTSSPDSSILVGFSSSFKFNNMYVYAYLLKLNQNQTYILTSSLPQSKGGLGFISCTFFKDSQLIAVYEGTNKTGYSQLSFYSTSRSAYIQSFLYEVDDYSICPDSNNLFIRTNGTIMLYSLENDTVTLLASATQSYIATKNFTCGWGQSIFIQFDASPYPFQKWEIVNSTLTKTASTSRDSRGAFTIKAVYEDSIMFKGLSAGVYFMDYNLNSFEVPFKEYAYIQINEVKDNLIIFANNYVSTATYFVLYEYLNRSLVHKGVYPATIGSQAVRRIMILPQSREIYMDYYNSAISNYESVKFKVDKAPQFRKGYLYDDENVTTCNFRNHIITKSLEMIVIEVDSLQLTKFSLNDDYGLKDTVILDSFSTVTRFKVSSSQKHVCVWGKSINYPKNTYVQARLNSNFSIIVYQKQLWGLESGENILDCEINDLQTTAVATFKTNTFVNLYLFDNSFKEVKVEASISSIKVLAVCQDNGAYAYTGIDSQTTLPSHEIIIDSLTASGSSKIISGCETKLIAFGKICDTIGYVCADDTVNVFDIQSKAVIFSQNFPQIILKLQILSSSKLLITTSSSVTIVNYPNSSNAKIAQSKVLAATANSSIAIDYANQLIAYSPDLKTISITDFAGKVVDNIVNKDGFDVVALAFKSTGELFVSLDGVAANLVSSLMVWANQPCPQNQTLTNSYCLCSDTYHPVNGSCICLNNQIVVDGLCGCPNNLSLINNSCSCKNNLIVTDNYCVCQNNLVLFNDSCGCWSNLVLKDGFCKCENNLILANNSCGCQYKSQVRNNSCFCSGGLTLMDFSCQCESGFVEIANFECEQCSFTCSECQDSGLFSCKQYSAWFYVIISAASLLIIGIAVIVAIKIKRKRAFQSQLQTNISESKQGGLLNQQKE